MANAPYSFRRTHDHQTPHACCVMGDVVFVGVGQPNLACNLAKADACPQFW